MHRVEKFGHKGLTYLYHYSGEIHIPKDYVTRQGSLQFQIAITQSLLPTHFVDPYEMKREYPNIVILLSLPKSILPGKVHNIETIQGISEQNLIVIKAAVKSKDFTPSLDAINATVVKFDLPILIHSTVLPPQKELDFVEVGIPKNSKVYINFLKANVANHLRGRFSTDCLFDNFVAVGSADENVHRKVFELRPTLNIQLQKVMSYLTAIFVVIGVLIFLKLILSAITDPREDFHRKSNQSHRKSSESAEKARRHSGTSSEEQDRSDSEEREKLKKE